MKEVTLSYVWMLHLNWNFKLIDTSVISAKRVKLKKEPDFCKNRKRKWTHPRRQTRLLSFGRGNSTDYFRKEKIVGKEVSWSSAKLEIQQIGRWRQRPKNVTYCKRHAIFLILLSCRQRRTAVKRQLFGSRILHRFQGSVGVFRKEESGKITENKKKIHLHLFPWICPFFTDGDRAAVRLSLRFFTS